MHRSKLFLLSSALLLTSTPVLSQSLNAQNEALGLYPANSFTTTDPCANCVSTGREQMLWYFRNEKIATAKQPSAKSDNNADANHLPPLVWLGAQSVLTNAKIADDGKQISTGGGVDFSFRLAPKIATNLSYWDNSTLNFFTKRLVRVRGDLAIDRLGNLDKAANVPQDKVIIAQTVWPEDFNIDFNSPVKPLTANESLKSLVQFENGGAKSAYESRLLWAKNTQKKEHLAEQFAGKAVLGFMLNGAQGDDDEARGGHFAVVTGRMDYNGDYSRWLVNNYYNLANNSEKGIIAAVTPMDKYMADLNSGQSFYRPSYMLVAVLKTDKTATQFQAATNKNFERFYANDFVYDHSRNNCAGTSLDTLRQLGWGIPKRGVESQLKATAAYFYVAATEMSLTKGRAIYDYLNTETTRLLPAVAFDAVGEELLTMSRQSSTDQKSQNAFSKQLSDDIEAIYFVRIPQFPSSRAFGSAPVYSFDQYMKEAPADRTKWKIIPTTPNPLTANLDSKHSQQLRADNVPALVPWPVGLVLALLMAGLVWLVRKVRNNKRSNT